MDPKGKLIPIGGGEDRRYDMQVLKRLVEETGHTDPIIEIITTATNVPDEVIRDYKEAFRSLELRNYDTIHIDSREEANDRKYLERIKAADAVLFSGGNQVKLSTILGGTDFQKILFERYQNENFIIAGTSAGAAAMSETMIVRGSPEDALIKGELELSAGFAFIKGVVIDTHFTQRGRFGRLIQAVATNPSMLGIGFGEDTGAVITDGKYLEIIGTGLVVVVDGGSIKNTNLNQIREGDPLSIEGVTLHVLCPGDHFLLDKRKFDYKNKDKATKSE